MSNAHRFTLYWSSLDTYEACPQRFLWQKGWGDIDVGGGLGRPKPIAERRSEHHQILGIAIQAALERFYNDELWKMLAPAPLRDRLLELAEEALQLELSRKYIDWRLAPTQDEMRQIVRDGVLGYMRTLKAHRLLGPYAKAELDMVAYADKDTPIGGRADVIIRREDTGVTIIDGKNGKRYKDGKGGWMTYTDPDQLRWYALLFRLCYRDLPQRLGFVYYRYPYGAPILDENGQPTGATEQGIDWVTFTEEDLKGLAQRAIDARAGIVKEQFDPRPTPTTCKLCDYEDVCPPRQAQKAANRRKPKAGPNQEAVDLGQDGFKLFTF